MKTYKTARNMEKKDIKYISISYCKGRSCLKRGNAWRVTLAGINVLDFEVNI